MLPQHLDCSMVSLTKRVLEGTLDNCVTALIPGTKLRGIPLEDTLIGNLLEVERSKLVLSVLCH
jgi:hypothetical protein